LLRNGGPGSSSLFGLFGEHGPFSVSSDASTLVQRDITWIKNYYVVYVDNPVGTGFSFTDSVDGFVRNEEEVGYNLYTFFTSFYNLYPQLLNNDLILCGESYGGKYIPALGYTIHTENLRYKMIQERGIKNVPPRKDNRPEPNMALPLVALSIGDGMMVSSVDNICEIFKCRNLLRPHHTYITCFLFISGL
jgi:carboxypeptidase C (cathepsin A)